MKTNIDKALDMALEALNTTESDCGSRAWEREQEAITAIKQARSAQVQEPVHQWQQKHSPYWYDGYPDNDDGGGPYETRTLYTTPPAAQRQWVGLTDEEIRHINRSTMSLPIEEVLNSFARAIEAKLKEKNT